jgi:methionyl aminopeptidase
MPVIIKSRREVEMMRRTGKIGHEILGKMAAAVRVGVTTGEINELAREALEAANAVGTSKNYPTYKAGEGFPAETCISVNDEVVHGIPGSRRLNEGDVVTLDLALIHEGYCADTAITVPVGSITPAAKKLLDVTRETLDLAIRLIRPDMRWSEVARQMQKMVESNGFSVVREFVGHGVGRSMHEDPKVANFVTGRWWSPAGVT